MTPTQCLINGKYANVDNVKYFHGEGEIFKVKVVGIQELCSGKTPGEEYNLKILNVIDTRAKKNKPEPGDEFSVWVAKDLGPYEAYRSWHLLDR